MPLKDEKKYKGDTEAYKLTAKERKRVKALQDRFEEMKAAEKKKGLRDKLNKWNKLYVPHKFDRIGLKKWQSKSAKNIAFTKVNTAYSVLIEQNPDFQYFPRTKQDRQLIPLWKTLVDYTNDVGKANRQWKKLVFNGAKDGTFVGQEYWKHDIREVKFETSYDPEKDKSEYRKETIDDFNNPYWTVLEREEVCLDEKATSWNPRDEHALRDWFKVKKYDKEGFKTRFPEDKYPNAKHCKPGGDLPQTGIDKVMLAIGKNQYEVLWYENKPKDEFSILCNGVLLRDRPLPYRHKQLSIFGGKFFERPNDIDGIGIPEAIENDEVMLDTLANTRIDQIILNIYRVLKVAYGEELEDEELELEPNKILRLRSPEVAQWMESDKIGAEAFQEEAIIKSDMDEKTGVSKELMGTMPSRKQTATETAINREAGLRRLKAPLDNIEDAMEIQCRLRIAMIKQIYSIPTSKEINEEGIEVMTYRNIRLPLKTEGKGFAEATTETAIEITPDRLMSEPDIKIKHLSTIPISKALERQKIMQFYAIIGNHPYTDTFKAFENICRAWEEDPEDWRKSEEAIIQEQQQAQGAMTGLEAQEKGPLDQGGGGATRTTEGTETGTAEVPISKDQGGFKKFLSGITGISTGR